MLAAQLNINASTSSLSSMTALFLLDDVEAALLERGDSEPSLSPGLDTNDPRGLLLPSLL